jgi:uncharacterized damage-inducible protein DinB
MRRSVLLMTVLAVLMLAGSPALAQMGKAPAKPKTSDEGLQAWNSMAKKIIEMAEDFPEDKYNYKPTPEVRSFAQLMLHIGGSNYYFTNAAVGREVAPAEDDPSRDKYKTKKEIVAYLTKSFADGAAAIKKRGERGMAGAVKNPFGERMITLNSFCRDFVEHSAEHYGNLVVYYRLNGMVPPASRPRR